MFVVVCVCTVFPLMFHPLVSVYALGRVVWNKDKKKCSLMSMNYCY